MNTPATLPTTAWTSEARVTTATPDRYVKRLCKHFAHKVEATWEDDHGWIDFVSGTCTLTVEPGTLVLQIAAQDGEALAELEDVVARHLQRFAEGRDELAISWSSASAA